MIPPGLLLQWQLEPKERLGLDFVLVGNAATSPGVQKKRPAFFAYLLARLADWRAEQQS